MAVATARLEFRVKPDTKSKIEHAAELVHESASDFARTAAEGRAEEVLRAHDLVTTVPHAFFDELLASLDKPPTANQPLQRATERMREAVKQQH